MLLPAPTTTRGTNDENLLTAAESVGLKLMSISVDLAAIKDVCAGHVEDCLLRVSHRKKYAE
jgi:hypothetical protein